MFRQVHSHKIGCFLWHTAGFCIRGSTTASIKLSMVLCVKSQFDHDKFTPHSLCCSDRFIHTAGPAFGGARRLQSNYSWFYLTMNSDKVTTLYCSVSIRRLLRYDMIHPLPRTIRVQYAGSLRSQQSRRRDYTYLTNRQLVEKPARSIQPDLFTPACFVLFISPGKGAFDKHPLWRSRLVARGISPTCWRIPVEVCQSCLSGFLTGTCDLHQSGTLFTQPQIRPC